MNKLFSPQNLIKMALDAQVVRRSYKLSTALKPRFLNFLCTFRCRSKCTMCNIWQIYRRQNGNKIKDELTISDIKKILSRDYEWLSSLTHVGLTGGDPILRPDIVELVKTLHMGLPNAAIGMQTTGLSPLLVERRLSEILDFYPGFSLAVSLDGTEDVHDQIRGIKGAWRKALESVTIAKKIGVERITMGMTLNPFNYDKILETKAIVDDLGGEFSCFMPEEADYFDNIGKKPGFSDSMIEDICIQLKDAASHHYYMDNMRLQLEGKRENKLRCYSGNTTLTLDPYGNIKPCILRSEKFGNIKSESLEKILQKDETKALRCQLKKCKCWAQCEVSTWVLMDPWDILIWLIFYSNDRSGFFKHIMRKIS